MGLFGLKNPLAKPLRSKYQNPAGPTEVGQKVAFTAEERKVLGEVALKRYSAAEDNQIMLFKQVWDSKLSFIKSAHDPDNLKPEYKSKGKEAILEKQLEQALKTYQVKRQRAWGLVLDMLFEWKLNLLANARHEEYFAADRRIPRAGRYVSFPLHSAEKKTDHLLVIPTTVTWRESNTEFQAVYYKTTCWFGDWEPPLVGSESQPNHNSTFKPFGETDLFIAAEFIEARYQQAPHLKAFHLRDRLESYYPEGLPWITLPIDNSFHYGQNSPTPTYRYLVYHPFVRPRNIPQRSFVRNNLVDMAKSVTGAVKENPHEIVSGAGSIAGAVVNRIEQWTEHYLRQFECMEPHKETPSYGSQVQQLNQKLQSEEVVLDVTQAVHALVEEVRQIDARNEAAEVVLKMAEDEENGEEEEIVEVEELEEEQAEEEEATPQQRRDVQTKMDHRHSHIQSKGEKELDILNKAAHGKEAEAISKPIIRRKQNANPNRFSPYKKRVQVKTPAGRLNAASKATAAKLKQGWLPPIRA